MVVVFEKWKRPIRERAHLKYSTYHTV